MIDRALFARACAEMTSVSHKCSQSAQIGTLKEKSIHSILKYYYAPDISYHEKKIGGYVADICVDGEIFEVQTRNFNSMRAKLSYFLEAHDVTIIYPVAHTKWISWLDTDTGELSPKRKSPKTGTIYQIIPELYRIKMFIGNPSLHFIIPLIDVEEVRCLNGWSRDRKRGSERLDGMPVDIFDEVRIDNFDDYKVFLPDTLCEGFTSGDLAKHAKIPKSKASVLLNVLLETGIIYRAGKSGNSYVYERTAPASP